ncbi:hypothetical protein L9F63_005917 [Diploptera punctata]|uniref:LRRCT domain-containing protein n=1 Tax=Diploptera punctata TaxID=6984 RepID=A0AAD8E5H8_DIPPU|nr:hypothetical protein L9F63_005917 [Diploptera punctata]
MDHSPDLINQVLGEGSVVSQLTRLLYLSIQDTKLVSIARHNIPQSVVRLNIAYNPLRCDCKLAWIVAKHKEPKGYLQDMPHTTCSTPEKYDEQELYNVVNPATCPPTSDGMFEQDIINISNSTMEEQGMKTSDHTLLYIILGSCLAVLLVIGIILAVVLTVMKKKRKHHITPAEGDTPMEQQQQIKQSSSKDMLIKK